MADNTSERKYISYTTLKMIADGTIQLYWTQQSDSSYLIYCTTSFAQLCVCSISKPADVVDFETNLKIQANNVASQDDAVIYGHLASGAPRILPRTSDGRIRNAIEKPNSSRVNFYSHDWTDPTTWYQQSVYITNETATVSTQYTVYQLAHSNIIDTYHGNITGEDSLLDVSSNSYRVIVKVNGTQKVEQDPHFGAGGDYTIDYKNGKITFLSALQPSDVVTATYHYANLNLANGTASLFTIKPTTGKKITLEQAECQFSTDVDPKDSVMFEVWGIADYFYPPSYIGNGQGKIPSGTVVMLSRFTYKSMSDFQNDAFKAYPTYPTLGNASNWRSQKQPVTVFDWDYITSTVLHSLYGMEIRCYLQHDTPFDGWMATATFYCTTDGEP